MTRYDLISPRPGKEGKTHWHRVGAGFPKDGGRFSLIFDALPLPDAEGRVVVMMSEAKPRSQQAPSQGNTNQGITEDEIPF